eukprot:scaffold647864_cov43-Prasinocladus_malaysianus.AAC.2
MASVAVAPVFAVAASTVSSRNAAPAGGLSALPPRFTGLAGSVQYLRGNQLTARTPVSGPSATRAARLPVLAATGGRGRAEKDKDPFEERVVQVRRVTKVVKGGKQLSFRAVVVVGDKKGTVGVGCAAAKEVVQAVQKAAIVARQECVKVPITRGESFPHRVQGRHGAAKVMIRPAAEGCGVIAGGATRVVLELAGFRNGFAKQLGTPNPLNNARATIEGLSRLRTWKQVAESRGQSVSHIMGLDA